ncbi:MAG TPA: DinB family protein [Gemmatimonadales bacterium]|nr:DinB family protein [Gemmatimonadales bacterium]
MNHDSMSFDLPAGIAVLERTPTVMRALLHGLPDEWLSSAEGPDTWSPYDVIGHLVHLEKTDWMVRIGKVLAGGEARRFDPVDRFAQFEASRGRSLDDLLEEFTTLRAANLDALRALGITTDQMTLEGEHPALGTVTLRNLLATWVAHDLGHLVQTGRVMAKQYRGEVGPWVEFLSVMK